VSTILFDRHNSFSGLQEVPRQNWLVLNAKELRLAVFDPITPGFVRMVIMLMGEILGLIKSLNLVFEAHAEAEGALRKMPGAIPVPTLSHVIGALEDLSFRHSKDDYAKSALTELVSMRRSTGLIWDNASSLTMARLTSPGAHTVIRTGELDLKEELFLVAWILTHCIESGTARPRTYNVHCLIDEGQYLFGAQ
jgi:hypothetical protein